jgi:transposase-like protein
MSLPQLSPLQDQIVAALANGASLSDAAAAAGIHRNTVGNWRRDSALFRAAFAEVHYDRTLLLREDAECLAATAIETIHAILTDPQASPSVRLKAALAILNQISAPLPEPPSAPLAESEREPKNMHKNAQVMPNTYRRDRPKTGRNELCTCGSGRKFKQCCLGKPSPTDPFA